MFAAIVGSRIPLRGVFGLQLGVAHQRVVQVVERGHTEDALVESPEDPAALFIREQEHGRELLHGVSLCHGMILHMGVEQRHIGLPSLVRTDEREERLGVDAINVVEAIDIAVEVGPSQICTRCQREIGTVVRASHRGV